MTSSRPAMTPPPSPAVAPHDTTTTNQPTTPATPVSNWTDHEVTQLDQLRSQGLSWPQISTHFVGRSVDACRKRHERHKKGALRRGSMIDRSNERGVIATPVELMPTRFLRVFVRETSTPLTTSQAQTFTNMIAPVDYTNMTPAQILQMHNQFLYDVHEVPQLSVPPSFTPVNSQSAQEASFPFVYENFP